MRYLIQIQKQIFFDNVKIPKEQMERMAEHYTKKGYSFLSWEIEKIKEINLKEKNNKKSEKKNGKQ